MPISFLPKVIARSVTQITPDWLKERNIRLLMLDFDNTIVPYTTSVPTVEMENWLRTMAASDIQVCVVSNSKKERVQIFCRQYGIPCITHARKPFSRGIRQCLTRFDVPACQSALCGDQIFTDTLGANGCGVMSILVQAIDNHNLPLKARHLLEIPFIALASRRRI